MKIWSMCCSMWIWAEGTTHRLVSTRPTLQYLAQLILFIHSFIKTKIYENMNFDDHSKKLEKLIDKAG